MLYEYYKKLHQIPELGFKEYKTSAYILSILRKTKAEIFQINTGICAFFDFNKTKTIAFRTEQDGLKIKEENSIPFKSKHNGYMHACGHDAHMAILLNLVQLIDKIENYPFNILFIFQPSEEKIGGALSLLPFLKKYDFKAFFGMHVFPYLQNNIVYTSKDLIFASSTEIDIKIKSTSCHIANYSKKNDSIMKTFSLIRYLERKAKDNNNLLHFGVIKGGYQRNSTAENCLIKGSLRCLSNENAYSFINKYFINTNEIKYKVSKTIPVLKNNKLLSVELINNLKIKEISHPFYQAEDFAFYNCFNTCFFLLGVNSNYPLHHPNFLLKEENLKSGYEFYVKLLKYFSSKNS